jgi:hypothetical protein
VDEIMDETKNPKAIYNDEPVVNHEQEATLRPATQAHTTTISTDYI